MENNPELQLAWQFIENTGTHLFLTGKAGTGKTTFLSYQCGRRNDSFFLSVVFCPFRAGNYL